MFRRLLVPLDGSRLAEAVLPVVRRMAEVVPCRITLLHVIEKRPPSSIHGDVHLHDSQSAEVYLASISQRLKEAGLEVDTHVHTVPQGDIPGCIAEHAGELEQDLIVLCTHGAGGVRRFVFGSNAEQVLTHGAAPVLFIHAKEQVVDKWSGPRRILVLLDNTPATVPALKIGAALAELAQARLYLLAVVPTLSSMSAEQAVSGRMIPHLTRHVLDLAAEEAAAYLQDEVDDLMGQGIPVSGRIERGSAAAGVERVAGEIEADLVIIASRGLAGLSALWADAITRKVSAVYDGVLLLIPRAEM